MSEISFLVDQLNRAFDDGARVSVSEACAGGVSAELATEPAWCRARAASVLRVFAVSFTLASSAELDEVGKRPLDTSEVRCAAHQQSHGDRGRDDQHWTRRGCAEQRPAEPLDHSHHRVQPVNRTPGFGKQATRVNNRSGKHPELG